jgi:hypothetical protein
LLFYGWNHKITSAKALKRFPFFNGYWRIMKKPLTIVLLCLGLGGCATTSTRNLSKISLDMKKDEVIQRLGEPTVVRGAMKNKFNQTVEIWEYKLSKSQAGKFWGDLGISVATFGIWAPVAYQDNQNNITNYWLYFYDGKLTQWGQAGDWKKEADRIYEINFAAGEKVTQ